MAIEHMRLILGKSSIDRVIRVKLGLFYEDILLGKQTNHGSRVKFSHEKLKNTN
jgi:hypothetical protein